MDALAGALIYHFALHQKVRRGPRFPLSTGQEVACVIGNVLSAALEVLDFHGELTGNHKGLKHRKTPEVWARVRVIKVHSATAKLEHPCSKHVGKGAPPRVGDILLVRREYLEGPSASPPDSAEVTRPLPPCPSHTPRPLPPSSLSLPSRARRPYHLTWVACWHLIAGQGGDRCEATWARQAGGRRD